MMASYSPAGGPSGGGVPASSELSQKHTQLLALADTIQLLIGGLEDAADIESDLLQLHGKLKQFQSTLDSAAVDVQMLAGADRRTWMQLLRTHRALLKEMRDDSEWKRGSLKDRIQTQRVEKALTIKRAEQDLPVLESGASKSSRGHPFAHVFIPPLNTATRGVPDVQRVPFAPKRPLPPAAAASAIAATAATAMRTPASPLHAHSSSQLLTTAQQPALQQQEQAAGARTTSTTMRAPVGSLRALVANQGGVTAVSDAVEGQQQHPLPRSYATIENGTPEAVSPQEEEGEDEDDKSCGCCGASPDQLKAVSRRRWCLIGLTLFGLLAASMVAFGVVHAVRANRATTQANAQPDGAYSVPLDPVGATDPPLPTTPPPVTEAPLSCPVAMLRLVDAGSSLYYPWYDRDAYPPLGPLARFAPQQLNSLSLQILVPASRQSGDSQRATLYVNEERPVIESLSARDGGDDAGSLRVFESAKLQGLRLDFANRLGVDVAGCAGRFAVTIEFNGGAGGSALSGTTLAPLSTLVLSTESSPPPAATEAPTAAPTAAPTDAPTQAPTAPASTETDSTTTTTTTTESTTEEETSTSTETEDSSTTEETPAPV